MAWLFSGYLYNFINLFIRKIMKFLFNKLNIILKKTVGAVIFVSVAKQTKATNTLKFLNVRRP